MLMRTLLLLGALTILFTSCSPDAQKSEEEKEEVEALLPPEKTCGAPLLLSASGDNGPSLGVFEVFNDTNNLWISFSHTPRYSLYEARIFIGSEGELPLRESGMPDSDQFKITVKEEDSTGRWFQHVPLADLPPCVVLSARIELLDAEAEAGEKPVRAWISGKGGSTPLSFAFCPSSCDNVNNCRSAEAGDFTTVPSDAWLDGAQSWASLLEEHFPKAFPNGLELGCIHTIQLQKASSALAFMGNGGKAAVLSSSHVNPHKRIGNSLSDELCALELSLGLDNYLEDFSGSKALLSKLEIASGAFQGWKVEEIVQEANVILGGCASNYSLIQITDVLQAINANFQSGESSQGFLRCPNEEL